MRTLIIISLLSLFCLACEKDRLTADGNIITEVRTPATFSGVHSSGANPIHISYGAAYKVEVRGSANLVQRFKTKTYGSTLNVGYERANIRHDDVEVFITMPVLEKASVSGSGNISINGTFPAQNELYVSISGSANIIFHDAQEYLKVNANISGSGDADMEHVVCKHSDIRISGSGDAHIHADERLRVRISGSGKVYYTGNPVIDSEISGSGRVIKF